MGCASSTDGGDTQNGNKQKIHREQLKQLDNIDRMRINLIIDYWYDDSRNDMNQIQDFISRKIEIKQLLQQSGKKIENQLGSSINVIQIQNNEEINSLVKTNHNNASNPQNFLNNSSTAVGSSSESQVNYIKQLKPIKMKDAFSGSEQISNSQFRPDSNFSPQIQKNQKQSQDSARQFTQVSSGPLGCLAALPSNRISLRESGLFKRNSNKSGISLNGSRQDATEVDQSKTENKQNKNLNGSQIALQANNASNTGMKFFEKPRLSQRNFSGTSKEQRLIFPVTLGIENQEDQQPPETLNLGLLSPISEYQINKKWDRNSKMPPSMMKRWFGAGPKIDQEISTLFRDELIAVGHSKLEHWQQDRNGKLAIIILCDQFSRNIFRGLAGAFSFDHISLKIAKNIVQDLQFFQSYALFEQLFVIMPLMHSEQVEDCQLCVDILQLMIDQLEQDKENKIKQFQAGQVNADNISPVERIDLNIQKGNNIENDLQIRHAEELIRTIELNKRWSLEHLEILQMFGRFPHRNKVLGRDNTEEEDVYLRDALDIQL